MIADFRVEFFFAFLANEAKLPDNNVCIGGKVYPEYQRYVSRGIRRLSFAKTSSAFSFNNLRKPDITCSNSQYENHSICKR
jgi:hypothetical protein